MSRTIREIIGEAIGEGSMCWMPRPEGVFLSTEAQGVVERATNEVIDIHLTECDKAFGLGKINLAEKLQTVLDHLDHHNGNRGISDRAYHAIYDEVIAIIMDLTKDEDRSGGLK